PIKSHHITQATIKDYLDTKITKTISAHKPADSGKITFVCNIVNNYFNTVSTKPQLTRKKIRPKTP
ncbi:MAG: hypothetical protein ACK559_07780, partial [bacterium]